MKVRYQFETIDGTAYSTLDNVDSGKAQDRIWEAAEQIGYSCATARFVSMGTVG